MKDFVEGTVKGGIAGFLTALVADIANTTSPVAIGSLFVFFCMTVWWANRVRTRLNEIRAEVHEIRDMLRDSQESVDDE